MRHLPLFAALLLAGCSPDPFVDVSGTVTLDGQPLKDGDIQFAAPDNSATPSAGRVENGAFKCRATEGAKVVRVYAAENAPPDSWGYVKQTMLVPPRYNEKSELKAEVTRGGRNVFEFALTSKP